MFLTLSNHGQDHSSALSPMPIFCLQTVPRKPVPNWGMPAYLDGALAWGSPPKQQVESQAFGIPYVPCSCSDVMASNKAFFRICSQEL